MAEVLALRHQGLTLTEIGSRLGISTSYASQLYRDPDGTKERERRVRYSGTCVVCGAMTDGSNGRAKAPRYCSQHATLNPDWIESHTKWPTSRIISSIRWWADKYGEPPSGSDWNPTQTRNVFGDEERALRAERAIRKGLVPWFTTVVYHFGSWSRAIEAAGFTPRPANGGGGNQARMRIVLSTHCKYGHPFDETNTYVLPGTGKRICRICDRRRRAKYRAAKRSVAG